MCKILSTSLLLMVFLSHASSMIMRNNALMSKMVSQFQVKDRPDTRPSEMEADQEQNTSVLVLMQNVLCKNFPSIPCEYITNDKTLRLLIEKSIQQLKYKRISIDKSTVSPSTYQMTLFPVINSEDISNFVQVSDTAYFRPKKSKSRKKPKKTSSKSRWSHEKHGKASVISGRKKLRKFYPHKIKYKDKTGKHDIDYSDKLSMSVEVQRDHRVTVPSVRKHFGYRDEPSDPPVWRIDYMKHGEPSFNMFGYDADNLKGKIIKTGPSMIVDEHVLQQVARKDVLHPDVYIKKNYMGKKGLNGNSEGYD